MRSISAISNENPELIKDELLVPELKRALSIRKSKVPKTKKVRYVFKNILGWRFKRSNFCIRLDIDIFQTDTSLSSVFLLLSFVA